MEGCLRVKWGWLEDRVRSSGLGVFHGGWIGTWLWSLCALGQEPHCLYNWFRESKSVQLAIEGVLWGLCECEGWVTFYGHSWEQLPTNHLKHPWVIRKRGRRAPYSLNKFKWLAGRLELWRLSECSRDSFHAWLVQSANIIDCLACQPLLLPLYRRDVKSCDFIARRCCRRRHIWHSLYRVLSRRPEPKDLHHRRDHRSGSDPSTNNRLRSRVRKILATNPVLDLQD